MKHLLYILLLAFTLLSFGVISYPIDGYESTGIKRLYQIKKLRQDGKKYTRIPAGAYKNLEDIKLNLTTLAKDSINTLLVEDNQFAKKTWGEKSKTC